MDGLSRSSTTSENVKVAKWRRMGGSLNREPFSFMTEEKTERFRAKKEDQHRLQWLIRQLAIDKTSVIKMAIKYLYDHIKKVTK